ncbi:hypothetical protein CO101_01645 [Candidatus Berkelbacteria bacterium CG_4_9_14_3_um_filter_39_23]|uniref:Glycosyl transferase family 1 n=1 Tax=Candidatus Berkelbacteria bacterium CG_4_9_14_3_um_filter_39_23 TaxID=1974508 RepID=A0A2M8C5T9_9BACT|nr:MAG: hypothetical protein CO101_01645 [Candidatus Berkelbacteria bacterium CG_4_9_14_3_um_filter_39_23]
MKILFVSEVYHPILNGVVISMDYFKRELERQGHSVFILAPYNYRDGNDEKNVFRAPSLPLSRSLDYFLALPNWITLETAKHLKPDIVHSHHIWRMGAFGQKIAAELEIPFVQTYHTLMESYVHKIKLLRYLPFTKNLTKAYIINHSRKFCNQAQTVISPSCAMKKILKSYKITAPIEVISTGINPDLFKFKNKSKIYQEFKIPQNNKILTFVGRLAYEKNVSMLLNAYKLIASECPATTLLILGDGPQKTEYENQAKKLGLEKKVIFTGFIDPRKTKDIFCSSDLFTFPSVTDTQAIVILEAMIAGAVPVAVNKLGPTDFVKNGYNGYLTSNNPTKFSQAVIKLIKNPKIHQRFQTEAKRTALGFTIEKQTAKLIELYQRMVSKKR